MGLSDYWKQKNGQVTPVQSGEGGGLAELYQSKLKEAKTAPPVEMVEQPLPKGAIGRTPGGDPYFGEGIPGMLKKWHWNMTKDVKDVSDDDWEELAGRWKNFWMPKQSDQTFLEGEAQSAGLAAQTASTAWQDMTQDGSLLSPALKFIGSTIGLATDLFSLGGLKAEQAFGAVEGLREAARSVDSPLPNTDDSMLARILETMPGIGLGYDVARIALSPSQNKWENTRQKIQDGWDSGRIFYSTLFDRQKKEEFLQRYHAGEDPGLLQMELGNTWVEAIGQGILDPLNFVGLIAKGAKTASQLNRLTNITTTPALAKTEIGKSALEAVINATGDARAVPAMKQLVQAQAEAVANVQKNSRTLNVGYGLTDMTTSTRHNAIISAGKDRLGGMMVTLKNQGYGPEGIAEAVLNGVRSVSKNADEMRDGLAGLAKLPNANLWLTDDYIETFTVVNRMMTNKAGKVDGGPLRKLLDIKDPVKFADEVEKLYTSAAKSQFKDVSEMADAFRLVEKADKEGLPVTSATRELADQYANLPNYVKVANRVNDTLKKFTVPVNKFLFFTYFNLQGGPAFRNFMSNVEMIFFDRGASAFYRDGKFWGPSRASDYLKGIYGVNIDEGFKTLVKDMSKSDWGFGKWMDAGERHASSMIMASSVRDTMKKMLPKAMPNLARHVETGKLSQRQANQLQNLLIRNGGNVRQAVADFRKMYKAGHLEEWRNLDFVSKFERESLEAFDLWDEVSDLARRGAVSQDEVEEVFANLNKVIDGRSELAVKDPIAISEDHPGIESWGDLMEAVESGHLSPDEHQYFTALMEIQEQARLDYQTLLDDVGMKAIQALNLEDRFEEAQQIGAELNRIRDVLRRGTPATAKKAHVITQDAWRWTEEVKGLKKPTREKLAEYWTRAGLKGEPPADLDKKVLLKQLWDERYEKVSDVWNNSFDAVVGESETVLKQMESVVDATELKSMASRTRYVTQQAQAIRGSAFKNGSLKLFARKDIDELAKAYNITPDEILTAINNRKGTSYASIDDVPTHDILKLIDERAVPGVAVPEGVAIPPPHAMGTPPTPQRTWNESSRGLKHVLDNIKNGINDRWGSTLPENRITPDMETVLDEVVNTVEPRMEEIKLIARKVAKENRDFALLNYSDKRYFDVALAYLLPFHFYYGRSYKNWISRLAQNPQMVANYGRLKSAMEKHNKDLPPWFKQQFNLNPLDDGKLFGMDVPYLGFLEGHPMYVNMEATFNPIYGITGTDYYDKYKRTNWATSTMDDMGKFGPTMYAPIQLGIAAMLYHQGETDAAARWAGRVIPQTNLIKSTTAAMFGKPIELDPAVLAFSGGIDPHERNRMSIAIPQLLEQGYSMEDISEAFYNQEGEIWDEAQRVSAASRAGSNFMSFLGGVGFKPRTENDVQIEQIQTDLNMVYSMSDYMTPEQFRTAQEQLRAKYPPGMVDTMLLARKSGAKRDASYAYEVLSRLPPGEMTEVFKAIGLSNDEIDKFYKSKGFTAADVKYTDQEKFRFMSAIVDLGAMLEMPESATRMEWAEVRNRSSAITDAVRETFGEDIYEKTDLYYDLKEDNPEAAQMFANAHPEIFAAQQLRREAILGDPLAARYYASLSTVEMYYNTLVREELTERYGPEIYDIQAAYFDATNQRAYLAKYPQLRRFWSEKRALEAEYEPLILQAGSLLEEGTPASFQEGFEPQSPTQEALFDALQPEQKIPDWNTVSNGMADWLQNEIAAYATDGRPVSKRAQNQLDYLADARGLYNGDQLLRMAVLALRE